MRVAIDFDGVISANFQHYSQLMYNLVNSGHDVHVITAANPKRYDGIVQALSKNYIVYHYIHRRPDSLESSPKNIGEWKKSVLEKYDINVWFDNEVKQYEQAGVDFSDLDIAIIRI